MMAGACVLAACNNVDEPLLQDGSATDEAAKPRVTVNAYVPDESATRLTFDDQGTDGLKVAWKESGETFLVVTTEAGTPAIFTQTEGSAFASPEGFTFADGQDYYAFYPELDADKLSMFLTWNEETQQDELNVSASAVPFDVASQTGQLDESVNLMYAKRSADGDFHFRHMLAVMKFTLKGIGGKLVNSVSINFTDLSEEEPVGYYSFGYVNVTGESPVFTYEYESGAVVVGAENLTPDADGNYVIYAYLPPLAAGTQIHIVAESEHEGYYKKWYDDFSVGADGIQAGKYYTAARGMEVGDVDQWVNLNHTAGNVEELQAWIDAVCCYPNVNLTLTADIDLSNVELTYDNDYDGTPESNWSNVIPVSGTIDGGGHVIKGMKIVLEETQQAAPLSIESSGVVKNLHLQDVTISGMYAAGLAMINNGTISGCSVSGSVTTLASGYFVGGIVGTNNGTVTGCYNLATLTGVNNYVGGIAAQNEGTITACYNTGALAAPQADDPDYIGGIVGFNVANATVSSCYWNCTSTEKGIGFGDSGNQKATQVDGTNVTWAAAASAMNTALPTGFGWQYVESLANANEPLKLQKVTLAE